MKSSTFLKSLVVACLLGAPAASVAQTCVGDCDGDNEVQVAEIVTSVEIGLGVVSGSACASIGDASIDKLIAAVVSSMTRCGQDPLPTATETRTPTVTPTATPTATRPPVVVACGNGNVDEGEECDNGAICVRGDNQGDPCTGPDQCPNGECRPVGGDDCAFNCTMETRREGTFTQETTSSVQNGFGRLNLQLSGTTALITGEMREDPVFGPEGQLLTNPGEVPVTTRADDVKFDPISLFPIVCACVVPIPEPMFGPGNSGSGVVGCGPQGLTDVNFVIEQDHNTDPGDPHNSGSASGLPDDPDCSNTEMTMGFVSRACREFDGEECSESRFQHPGVCNSPRRIKFSGGAAPRGSLILFNSTAITQLSDGGACGQPGGSPGDCEFNQYGPDCVPCTDDDFLLDVYGPDCMPCTPDDIVDIVVNVTPTTSGQASAIMYDRDNQAGLTISEGGDCAGAQGCKTMVTGQLADCEALQGSDSLAGALATAFPGIDTETLGDTVTTTLLASE